MQKNYKTTRMLWNLYGKSRFSADAKKIRELSFSEANELANFGTTVLHAKTIIPL